MPLKRTGTIDLDTGELFDGTFVFVGRKIKSPYGREWMMVNQNFLEEFAARKDVGEQALRVFLYLNARLDFDNLIQVPQIEVAAALKMDKADVNKAIRKLLDMGVILKGPRVDRSSSYRLNPMAGWKGKVKNLRPALASHLHAVKGGKSEATADLFPDTPIEAKQT